MSEDASAPMGEAPASSSNSSTSPAEAKAEISLPIPSADSSIQERADALFLNSEILAPMVRASTTPLRTLALSYGADLVYTEEIVDRSITTCNRVVNDKLGTIDYVRKTDGMSAKVLKRLESKGEIPVILRIAPNLEKGRLIYQIGTGEANLALPAALFVQRDVDGIDVNMGCPKKFSVSGGMGSALLSDLPRACDIIRTLRANLNVPVSAKIRLLSDDESSVDFIRSLIKAGANAVTIHAREVGDESQQPAKWDRLVNVVQAVKAAESVPIIINGDFFTRDDMVSMKQRTGADGVMLARPALYNVSLFKKPPATAARTEASYGYDSPLLENKTSVVQTYLEHCLTYAPNFKNVKYVVCEMMNNRRNPSNIVHNLPLKFSRGQTIKQVCNCRNMDEMCKLWDVNLSTSGAVAATVSADGTEQRYDDRYFLDPEALKRERRTSQQATAEERSELSVVDVSTGTTAPTSSCCKSVNASENADESLSLPEGTTTKRQRID
mmetsp:Transcript_14672/g.29662  ORF Transcript_14672/g.29662 Transcript_14672/m.29662 type:complete len:497 (-) Transcript_14672:1262-2752(-)